MKRVSIVGVLVGGATTILASYIAALIAKHDEVLNGFLSSLLCVAWGVYGMVSGRRHTGTIETIALFALTLACGTLGGWLRSRHSRATQQ